MASIDYMVRGRSPEGERILRRFKERDGKEAKAFAKTLVDAKMTYQVRGRVNGRQVARNFDRKVDAQDFADEHRSASRRGTAIDPRQGRLAVGDYGRDWLNGRKDLSETTWELYDHLFRTHIVPTLGKIALAELTQTGVKTWHGRIARDHPNTAAKAYRLLRSIMNAAVEDHRRADNPCRVKGAGTEPPSERPSASLQEVDDLVRAMPAHLRLIVVLATWTALRRGELLGLQRRHIDVVNHEVIVRETEVLTLSRRQIRKDPKTMAGRREVVYPSDVAQRIEDHLENFVALDPEAPVFTCTFSELRGAWNRARQSIGRPELHMHDLRGIGLTLAGIGGATSAELMHRAGHSTPAMVMRYQRATKDRDRLLADSMPVPTNLIETAQDD